MVAERPFIFNEMSLEEVPKFSPLIVISVPLGPETGVNPTSAGVGSGTSIGSGFSLQDSQIADVMTIKEMMNGSHGFTRNLVVICWDCDSALSI
jgi:hypothetical protein